MFIVKVPGVNADGRTIGCERAGNAILEALKKIHSNEKGIFIDTGLFDLEEIHLDNNDLKLTNKLIYENAFETFEIKPRTIFLGGDHSISYSLVRAFLDFCSQSRKEPCLIVFDAHADCLSISGEFPFNREWLRALIENGFPRENILIVGMRNVSQEEIKFLSENNIARISINNFLEDIQDACDGIMEFANGKELYVSIDIDSIDPVFAPSTELLEQGGFTSRQFFYLIQRISKMKNLRAVDIVEINSEKDKQNNNLTVKLGAKILAELL